MKQIKKGTRVTDTNLEDLVRISLSDKNYIDFEKVELENGKLQFCIMCCVFYCIEFNININMLKVKINDKNI